MGSRIISLRQRFHEDAFDAEWDHQLSVLENSLRFFADYFRWSQSISVRECITEKDIAEASFYSEDMPYALEEAQDAINALKLITNKHSTMIN